ncbi:cytochrome P450 CYP82J17-like [Coffea arabica]|uniref:Cytochrome P450 CYP82J17-like n=1 Tax=Coffea arabica TaxID=13443 RepID=A0ABM4WPZ8_COFAR
MFRILSTYPDMSATRWVHTEASEGNQVTHSFPRLGGLIENGHFWPAEGGHLDSAQSPRLLQAVPLGSKVLIVAGTSTTSRALSWIISLLLNHRHVLQKAQEEIDSFVGKERWVEESDIKNLVYLQAIVKETMRLHPPAPVPMPRQADEDCNVALSWR